jgi:uncharacterized Zn-binding protein involved in type VI secretion
MAGEIIRLGDSTSHGGIVIEGSPVDICMGKPIAFIGHKVQCPKCKGIYPIVEGAPTTTFYGKGVALAGMRTGCGALLIAGQLTDIVECGGGERPSKIAARGDHADSVAASSSDIHHRSSGKLDETHFDDKFTLVDADTGSPIPYAEYAIRRQSGEIEHGTSDVHGHTHLLSATANAETIEIYV